MQWLSPVTPALGGPRLEDHLRPEVPHQPGQHGETPFLQKIQKISQAWWWVPVVPATREAEAAHSSLGSKSKTPRQEQEKEMLPAKFLPKGKDISSIKSGTSQFSMNTT